MHTLPDLQTLFDFTADDLDANRAGQLSGRQRAQIEAQRLNASIEKASTLVSVGVFLAGLALYLSVAYKMGQTLGPWVLAVACVWLTLAVAAANLAQKASARWLRRTAKDRDHGLLRRFGRLDAAGDEAARAGRVERFAGLLTHGDDGEHPHLMLDGEPFQADGAIEPDDRLWQLAPGQRYAFYAVPGAGWVVATEPVSSE